jgi:uncharacterized membrane protein YhaH (DUF805 family)
MDAQQSGWSFLFRSDEGRVDAKTWRRNAALLLGIFAVLTFAWSLIEPYAHHDLATEPLFTFPILAANLYRIFYGFASLLLLVCYYNLSAKRWRDIGRPPALAGLLPFVACIAWALHWLEPRVGGEIPHFIVILADVLLAVILIWSAFELGGFTPGSRKSGESH